MILFASLWPECRCYYCHFTVWTMNRDRIPSSTRSPPQHSHSAHLTWAHHTQTHTHERARCYGNTQTPTISAWNVVLFGDIVLRSRNLQNFHSYRASPCSNVIAPCRSAEAEAVWPPAHHLSICHIAMTPKTTLVDKRISREAAHSPFACSDWWRRFRVFRRKQIWILHDKLRNRDKQIVYIPRIDAI